MTKEDMILDWQACRDANPEYGEFFELTEHAAANELWNAKKYLSTDILEESGLENVETPKDLENNELLMDLVDYFSSRSVYDFNTKAGELGMNFEMHIDNAEIFSAVLIIDIAATLQHVTGGFPMIVNMYFNDEESEYKITNIVMKNFPQMFPAIVSYNGLFPTTPVSEEIKQHEIKKTDIVDNETYSVVYKFGGIGKLLNRKLKKNGRILYQTFEHLHRTWNEDENAVQCFEDADNHDFTDEKGALDFILKEDEGFEDMDVLSESGYRLPARHKTNKSILKAGRNLYPESNNPDNAYEIAWVMADVLTDDADEFPQLPIYGRLLGDPDNDNDDSIYDINSLETDDGDKVFLVPYDTKNIEYEITKLPLYKILWYMRCKGYCGIAFERADDELNYVPYSFIMLALHAKTATGPEAEEYIRSILD